MNMRLFQEIFELNQAFERVIEGLKRMEKVTLSPPDVPRETRPKSYSSKSTSIATLSSSALPNESILLTPPHQQLQKMLKYGLPTQSTIALFEAGFSDRVIASDLAVPLNLNGELQRDVIQRLRAERPSVNQALQKYPSYFTHVLNDVL